jgi:two-component system nitrate/nitrite response regulator NarL
MKACLICDDHALVREALSGTVRLGWPNARVTTVGDFPAAWGAAPGHDCCIADLMMPGADPVTGIVGLRRAAPDMAILVVTGTEDDRLLTCWISALPASRPSRPAARSSRRRCA